MKGINYVGSTNNIKGRTKCHKSSCYNKNSKKYNLLVYQYIREKEMKIELEILFCYKKNCSKKITFLIEQFYINKFNSFNNGFNSRNAFLSKKKRKKYNEEYKEIRKKKYEKNKNIISQKNKIKINCCRCGSLVRKDCLKRHQKTKKCKSLSKEELDFKYDQNAYNEEGEFLEWF